MPHLCAHVPLIRRACISVRLRGRPGALLLAAARLPRQAAARLRSGRHPLRVPHRLDLRPPLHGSLRPSNRVHGLLARPPGPGPRAGGTAPGVGADTVAGAARRLHKPRSSRPAHRRRRANGDTSGDAGRWSHRLCNAQGLDPRRGPIFRTSTAPCTRHPSAVKQRAGSRSRGRDH